MYWGYCSGTVCSDCDFRGRVGITFTTVASKNLGCGYINWGAAVVTSLKNVHYKLANKSYIYNHQTIQLKM